MRQRAITITCISLLASSPLFAMTFAEMTTAHPKAIVMSISDAVMLSLRNNSAIRQSEIQRIADKFALTDAEHQFQPKYTLKGSAQWERSVAGGAPASRTLTYGVTPSASLENHYGTKYELDSTNESTNGVYNPGMTFSITQPLIRGFGKPVVDATLNNARDSELTSQLNFKNGTIATVSTVINDYLALVQAYKTLEVDKESLKNYQETVNNDKSLIAAGRMARGDIVQAQAQVQSQLSTIQSDLNGIVSAKNTLLNDLGLPPQLNIIIPKHIDFLKLAKKLSGNSPLPTLTDSQHVALKNNIDYQVATIALRELRRDLLLSYDNDRWKVNATASEEVGDGSGGGPNGSPRSLYNRYNHNETVGLDVEVPIDDVDNQADIINKRVALQKALIALTQSKRNLLEKIQSDRQSVITSKAGLALSKRALALQQRTVYIAQEKQLAGKVSTFEVVTNQQNLAKQMQSVVSGQISYLTAIVNYEQDLGVTLEPWHIHLRY